MRIAIGADHAGFELKQHLVGLLEHAGHLVEDHGTDSTESVDYPPIMAGVGRAVAAGAADRGIVLGGSGQGEQMAANKVRGVRAALCNDLYTARMARQHNDANVLSMGARVVGTGMAEEIVALFLETDFEGGRHQRRVDQLMDLEGFDLHEALYTTRAMRRLAPDPVPEAVVARILDAAVRGPSGGNRQAFRFLLVTDAGTRRAVGELYRAAFEELMATTYAALQERLQDGDATDPGLEQSARIDSSARWLADHVDDAPLMLFLFGGERGHSTTFPVLWNACLAARAEGVGTTITTLLSLRRTEVERLLGVPEGDEWQLHAMVPMGYPTGRWGVARREPPERATYAERWGAPVAWSVPEPLWPTP